jgi:hypothetical protein
LVALPSLGGPSADPRQPEVRCVNTPTLKNAPRPILRQFKFCAISTMSFSCDAVWISRSADGKSLTLMVTGRIASSGSLAAARAASNALMTFRLAGRHSAGGLRIRPEQPCKGCTKNA